jgi:S1-C subfamily serine protease
VAAADPIRGIALLKFDGTAPAFNLGTSDEVRPGDEVITLGYPHMDFGRLVLTQFTTEIGARILVGSRGLKSKHLLVNTQARVGQSGGPVVSKAGRVVGMVLGSYAPHGAIVIISGIDPLTLHQTTHAISAEYILEMLRDV